MNHKEHGLPAFRLCMEMIGHFDGSDALAGLFSAAIGTNRLVVPGSKFTQIGLHTRSKST